MKRTSPQLCSESKCENKLEAYRAAKAECLNCQTKCKCSPQKYQRVPMTLSTLVSLVYIKAKTSSHLIWQGHNVTSCPRKTTALLRPK